MKSLSKTSVLILIIALSFFGINEVASYYLALQEAKNTHYEKDKQLLNNLIDSQSKNLAILAEVLSIDENVIEGYKKNDPKIIQEHIFPIWKKVKDKKLTYEIHFFKPPAESFVNFSNFKSIGDDVSDIRTDIEWVSSSFKPSVHTLMCKTYAGYRATLPILDENGKLLGGLSLGKKIDWLPEVLKQRTAHDSFLVYTKVSTQSLLKKYYADFIKDKEIIGEYILANKTIDISAKELKKIDFTQNIQNIFINNENYILYNFPIIDFNNNIIGYIFTVTKLQEFKSLFLTTLFKNFILIFLTAIVMILLTRKRTQKLFKQLKYIKNITKNIKNRDFHQLHNLPAKTSVDDDLLLKLEHNIINMGLELEGQYKILEDENLKMTQQIIEQLYRDELTSLANRNALFRDLKKNKDTFIAVFNIRSFKEINDVFGFETGNFILKELAQILHSYSKNSEISTYRIGGDEFVILAKKSTMPKGTFEDLVSNIIYKIEKATFNLEDKNINMHLNIYAGICLDKKEKLKKAAMALTQAKKERKEYIVYTHKENTEDIHLHNITTINKVMQALQNNTMIVYYQPIVDISKNIIKYEALIRMKDGNNVISPYFFLEIAKKTRHYDSITRFVIEKTFEKFQTLDKSFSVNLTAEDILNKQTLKLIIENLTKFKEPNRVVFELVESNDLYNLLEIEEFIKTIKKIGANIAIDDFGTGYSNFAYMLKIKPEYIKIDGSIIKNINTDKNAYLVAKTIVSFAQNLHIKTIAEFVHSEEIFEICKEIGVDEYQGYYFGQPSSELKT